MREGPSPESYELRRTGLVRELGLMNNDGSQDAYDRIAGIAKRVFVTDIALITFVDGDRHWFKSRLGTDLTQTPCAQSFCTHAMTAKQVLVVENALDDPQFHDNALVVGAPHIRFYAGTPLLTHEGYPIGTICVMDKQPRRFEHEDQYMLQALADLVMTQMRVDSDLTHRDTATNMPNRIQFFTDLAEFGRTHEAQDKWVVLIELMGMHEANDAVRALGLGYIYDQIAHSAERIRFTVDNATVYHVGPAHLAFCLDKDKDALQILDSVVARLRQPFITSSGIPAKLAPGCGARNMTGAELFAPEVLRTLLQAAREARDSPRGVALYDPIADGAHRQAFSLVVEMPRALSADELFLVYQPRVNAQSELWEGAEALLRWRHPSLGVLTPGNFLPLITKTPLIRDVTDWVMDALCRQLGSWQAENLNLRCSFNVSARNLEEDDFVERLACVMAEHAVDPRWLEIEIVEDVSATENETILSRLIAIRDLGVTIAIDDFGSGYSNLAYLLELPATVLKLERSIVAGILTKPSYATATASIIAMGHQLGYRIVGEGVETDDIKEKLVQWGCDELQGYLFAKPLEAEAFKQHLLAR